MATNIGSITQDDPLLWIYRATVAEVIDGDTADLIVDKGFHEYAQIRVRFNGIDAPESYGVKASDAGRRSKAYLKERLTGKAVIVQTFKDKTEKYGRYLADIYLDGICINDELVEMGFAKPYDGGTR